MRCCAKSRPAEAELTVSQRAFATRHVRASERLSVTVPARRSLLVPVREHTSERRRDGEGEREKLTHFCEARVEICSQLKESLVIIIHTGVEHGPRRPPRLPIHEGLEAGHTPRWAPLLVNEAEPAGV